MKKLLVILTTALIYFPVFSQPGSDLKPVSGATAYADLRDFGAKGDGLTDDTKAVQKAIDECAALGKKLIFPAGTFMTGTIILRSNTAIELTLNTVWKGIGRLDVYPGQQRNRPESGRAGRGSLIYAQDVENISISGQGMIWGNGEHPVFHQLGTADSPERPFGLWIIRCRNVNIEGIQMLNSAYWMQNYVECDHLRITGVRVFNHSNLNNDGMDITDCHDVIISDCVVDSSDDGICPKSSNARGVSDMVVSNCIIASHADAFKMGTASSGGFRRITVSNLVIRPSKADHVVHPMKMGAGLSGIDLMSSDGGVMEDITIQNVVMDSVETPITIKLGDRWAGRRRNDTSGVATGTPGVARNIFIGNVIARHSGPIPSLITGYPGHYVENITLSNIRIETVGGFPAMDVPVPENSGGYPFNRMFGMKNPSYGFFIRHVNNIKFRDVQLVTNIPDERRAFYFEDATGTLENVDVTNSGGQQRPTMLVDREETIALRGSNSGLKIQVASPLIAATQASANTSAAKTQGEKSKLEIIKDIDGNQYTTVKIGNQAWLAENLKTTHYNNGKAIPEIKDDETWRNLTSPGYCWFKNNEEANKNTQGALYNWYTISNGNVCPSGWHVPSDAEWRTLALNSDDGQQLDPTGAGSGSGIVRDAHGAFYSPGGYLYRWSATESCSYYFLLKGSGYFSSIDYRLHRNKNYGFTVRCIKD